MSGAKKRIIENGKSKLVPTGYVFSQRKSYEKERARAEAERTKFYKSRLWQKNRYQQLIREPLCERCKANDIVVQAVIVHHIVDTNTLEGWERRLDPENLESICFACHNKETFGEKEPPTLSTGPVFKNL
ncbi:TPA: HNH endonuclease [Listeria monocytogenes]|uniref:HNH endonuclease signature motif containing protein n=1 Tax=Listeria monocytogenes TaxID=1639 RepID=UPI001805D02B|nr:HNH endonuclease [Listeria monocytogenes]MCE8057231.1 HNH endonuclease [Listeria monocytogenes]HAC5626866.1 hypothetical protein [Listeria monocytogenes]HBL8234970.1 HNH endonuclease [Listeria monocytogenes]